MTSPIRINDLEITVAGSLLKEARPNQEWYQDVDDPEALIAALAQQSPRADILTFWQRLPDVEPKYSYAMEWEEIAALPITTFDHWWSTQIKSRTRGLIRKSAKQGVEVREVEWTDEFVLGITRIFNETPMRQGQPFWHFGKDFETVKRQFSRYLFRERLLGAYYGNELIGFMMVAMAGKYAITGQIISMVSHREKGTNNALIAKAVEVCAREQVPYLVYLHWGVGSLAEFKRRNGFEKTRLPRYFVPLTIKGKLALRFGMHRGLAPMLPKSVLSRLKQLRAMWYRNLYAVRYRHALVDEAEF